MKPKKTVLFVGANGFPFGSAMIQRQLQLANSLLNAGFNVTVINRKGTHNKTICVREHIFKGGNFKGINYLYASLVPYKPRNFFARNLLKVFGFVNELFIVIWYRLFKNCRYVFNNSVALAPLKYYCFLTRILNIKFIYDYVELIASLAKRDVKSLDEIKAKFDYKFIKFTDAIICISSFLDNHVHKIAPHKKTIKIPPIIDFSFYESVNKLTNKNPYFLFCGSAAYYDIITFIITAFTASIGIDNGYHLKLVINGTDKQIKVLKEHIIKTGKADYIKVLSQLSYTILVSFYKSSFALLIPISDSLQDKARFPFKISEYTAAKRPIITSDSGPVKEFFTDNDNALIAKHNNLNDFTEKMNYLIKNTELSDKIGNNGYLLGKKVFNYKTYSQKLREFLEN